MELGVLVLGHDAGTRAPEHHFIREVVLDERKQGDDQHIRLDAESREEHEERGEEYQVYYEE
jgi:hypothetical protein